MPDVFEAVESLKSFARIRVHDNAEHLLALSHTIHANPELAFQEHEASARIADTLSRHGFSIHAGVAGLPTAFVATAGSGPLVIAICAEYDALPGIGHACGHNVIASCATGAGIALAAVADDLAITVKVIGTPAEEGGGGKIILLEHGVFDGVHAAMMVHPASFDTTDISCLAVSHIQVSYTGEEAHASAFPERGVNAADALTIAQVSIGLLRQHLRPKDQVHGIVTLGGSAPNVVPKHAQGQFMIRARTLEDLATLEPRIERCFRAGATATGAELSIERLSPTYSDLTPDVDMLAFYTANAERLGRSFAPPNGMPITLSTDMANVSRKVPSIHPMIGIDAGGATNHQPEFAAACISASADRAVLDGATAMAWTAIDLSMSRHGT
ncbi:MAG: M20 family metallopeptidase [Actinomycetota bacterium]|nr:M20 family metallopeptidase [Actinomycetota bacterium]